ncbi:type III-B CRISPR module-associated protein Cmr5 [Saccharopolyspora flava]|uniref:CRISPR type III-B/RAMP module-associated protein Cmr5 n=1 Tax=Saccharopolyspora flava TaxID=95161 RepID=A0A1I6UK04_9PSEU|nr:type III-B CRISPR module-associated protein Cmr5 [Saccharopolyspora flava]SFT01758.1 CRISPR/Cas system CMR-associated protein Cmr5, small subunit [Saccharopolyspora flava]
MTQRIDQELAVTAATALRDVEIGPELLSVLRSLPVLIHNNGLVMASTYLLSKADKAHDDDRHWRVARTILTEAARVIQLDPRDRPLDILDQLSGTDGTKYAVAQRRAQELATWLSRVGSAKAAETSS